MSRLAVDQDQKEEEEVNILINSYVDAYNKEQEGRILILRLQLIRIDKRYENLPSDTSFKFKRLTSEKVKMLALGKDVDGYFKHVSRQQHEEERRKELDRQRRQRIEELRREEHDDSMASLRRSLADAYADGYKDGLQQGRQEMSRRITELQSVIEALGGRETPQTRRLIL